ncbi:MAG TPA: GH1 family beta-glucosidase [Gaiellaceae bacterium]
MRDGFLWGVGTSAFQIEGALDADGRGASIWDDFPSEAGETGAVACDSYRRWREDVDLVAALGVNAYRFSIAWPRVMPDGTGAVEQRGVDHYSRLIDALLERGIEPVVTLYHWDLPVALDWRRRETVDRFVEYAQVCFDAYGDRVNWWLTINEPWIVGLLGFLLGLHAPGVSGDVRAEVTVFHHLLLAHGRAVDAFGGRGKIGLAPNLAPHYPASPADAEVSHASDGYVNRWFLDAIYKGSYPDDQRARYEQVVGELDFICDGDLEEIARPTGFLGINYYAPRVMEGVPGDTPWPWRVVVPDQVRTTAGFTDGVARTDAGTPIVPHALTDLLVRVRDDYGSPPIMITENGGVFPEAVHDERRIHFIRDHLLALEDAVAQGVDVLGYCHWSLLDNFEWKLGYAQRFGLVHVDYDTQERTIKDSGRYYAACARANVVVPV